MVWATVLRGLFVVGAMCGICATISITGCNQKSGSTADAQAQAGANLGQASGLPTASIPNPGSKPAVAAGDVDPTADDDPPDPEAEQPLVMEKPQEGTPEFLLQAILELRARPLGGGADELPDDGDESDPAMQQKIQAVLDKQRAEMTDRNHQAVKLAEEAIALTHKDAEKETVFNAAVHHFLDAHLQLALQGDQDSIGALYDAAETFYKRKPESKSAMEAAQVLVKLAHTSAVNFADREPRWVTEFAKQARLYATRFPKDEDRCITLLATAGTSCDLHGIDEEARACFTQMQQSFPTAMGTQQYAGVLRRMSLKGKPVQVSGPTLDGNLISVDDFRSKLVVVIFWASQVQPFTEKLPKLIQLHDKYKKAVAFVGVNMDDEESTLDQFMESFAKEHQTPIPWPNIFHPQRDKQGWNAPLAVYYGIQGVPTIWILDAQGNVAETHVTVDNLEQKLRDVHKQAGVKKTAVNDR